MYEDTKPIIRIIFLIYGEPGVELYSFKFEVRKSCVKLSIIRDVRNECVVLREN